MAYHIIIIRITVVYKNIKEDIMGLLFNLLASLGTLAATLSTSTCPIFICDEPEMPRSLLEK